mmetsp:Transcript_18893/g.41607  ORF Transcript_18893/g.41607 Transcript_18893/m.41607 type:complete len:118 (-) Transcript_18893:249-602(-)
MINAFGCNDKQSFSDMHVTNMDTFINLRIKLEHFTHRIVDGCTLLDLERFEGRLLICGGNHQNERELVLYEIDMNGNYTKRESYGVEGTKYPGVALYNNKLYILKGTTDNKSWIIPF